MKRVVMRTVVMSFMRPSGFRVIPKSLRAMRTSVVSVTASFEIAAIWAVRLSALVRPRNVSSPLTGMDVPLTGMTHRAV